MHIDFRRSNIKKYLSYPIHSSKFIEHPNDNKKANPQEPRHLSNSNKKKKKKDEERTEKKEKKKQPSPFPRR